MATRKALAFFLLLASWGGLAIANNGSEVFTHNCASCHDGWGGYGAPGTANYDVWRPALKRGSEEMFLAVRDGRRSMAPRAGNPTLTDDDLRNAVQWLVKEVNGE